MLIAAVVPSARRTVTCLEMFGPWWPEPEAVAFMRDHQLTGRLVTFFRWGEYGIWNLPPGLKVSMDGRRETVYSDRVVAGHLELYDGTAAGLAYLGSLDADFIWFPRSLPVNQTLQQQRLGAGLPRAGIDAAGEFSPSALVLGRCGDDRQCSGQSLFSGTLRQPRVHAATCVLSKEESDRT